MADLKVKIRLALENPGVVAGLGNVVSAIAGIKSEAAAAERQLSASARAMRTGITSISSQLDHAQKALLGYVGVMKAMEGMRAVFRTAADFESLDAAMRTVFGSATAARAEMDFLRRTSDRLGVSLQDTAHGYLGFAAAAMGTSMAGEKVREVFVSVMEASVALGLSQEQSNGALLALQQMMSKGTVSAEELRQQLGERLYGAMQQAAASIGYTTAEFSKLLDQGLIPADRFLPAFADRLRQTFGAGVADAANTARAAIARFDNAITDLKLQMADSGMMDAMVDAIRSMTASFKDPEFRSAVREFGSILGTVIRLVTEHAKELAILGGVVTGARTGAFVGQIGGKRGQLVGAGVGAVVGGVGAAWGLSQIQGSTAPDLRDAQDRAQALTRQIAELESRMAMQSGQERARTAAFIAEQKARLADLQAQATGMISAAASGAGKALGQILRQQEFANFVDRFKSRADELRQAMETLRAKAQAAGIATTSAEYRRAEAAIRAKFATKGSGGGTARLTALKNELEAGITLLKDATERSLKDLDRQLADHRISLQAYYAERVRLAQEAIAAEIAAKRQELALAKDQGEGARITAEITLLERKRGDVAVQARADQIAAERRLQEQLAEVRASLLEAQGRSADAAGQRLQSQYRELLASLRAEGDQAGADLVRKLIDVQSAKAALDQLQAEWSRAVTAMQTAEQATQAQVETGLLTEMQGREKIVQLHKDAGAQLDALLPRMEALARASENPDAIAGIARLKLELQSLRQVADETATRINGGVMDGVASLFSDLMTGARSATDAFRAFAKSVLDSIAQILSQRLAQKLFGGVAGGAGGLGGLFSSGLQAIGFATGGPVPGSGSGDTVPAMLTPGEYVIRKDTVRRFGLAFFDAVNGLRLPQPVIGGRIAFAQGGPVPTVSQAAPQAAPVRLELSVHPDALRLTLADWLEGEIARVVAKR